MKPRIYPYVQKDARSSTEKVVFLISLHAITDCINDVILKTNKGQVIKQSH